MFKLLASDGLHSVDVEQFANGGLRLKGEARTIDVAKMGYETSGKKLHAKVDAENDVTVTRRLAMRTRLLGRRVPATASCEQIVTMLRLLRSSQANMLQTLPKTTCHLPCKVTSLLRLSADQQQMRLCPSPERQIS